ncbi:MAG: carboxypeptidase regulatory-like domain-containing protein, partial [Candidatus Angelobacter sp.]
AWADGILKANQDKEVIVVTHAFTFTDNTRMSRCDANSAASFGVGQDNDGDAVWWKLVRKYANIRMVLSGHVNTGDGTGHRIDIGAGGNLVNQMLSDYQSDAMGGGGYLRMIRISPSLNSVSVSTYSPYTNSYKTDSHNQFTVPYLSDGTQGAGTISGRVRNAVSCKPVSGVTVAFSGGSGVTDSNGMFSISAPAISSFSITATLNGWASDSRSATASPDQSSRPSPTKIFLAAAGRISGYIRTPAGAPVAGAILALNGGDLRLGTTVTTDSSGAYDSGPLAIGRYTVSVSAPGYAGSQSAASVNAGASTVLDVNLQ